MPFTGNPTPHYNFGQYLGTDKSSWYDNNSQFANADTAIFGVEQLAQTAGQTATAAQGTANQANTAAVAAGNKADALAVETSNIKTWVRGSLANPNQGLFGNGYDSQYAYNKELNLLTIFGYAQTTTGSYFDTNNTIFANISGIPGIVLPISESGIGVKFSSFLYRWSAPAYTACQGFRIMNNGQCLVNIPTGFTENPATQYQWRAWICTEGWGSSI